MTVQQHAVNFGLNILWRQRFAGVSNSMRKISCARCCMMLMLSFKMILGYNEFV